MSRLQNFQRNAQNKKFISVIGHGTLINPLENSYNNISEFFKVPEGVAVIFVSKPGYFVALRNLKDDKMMSLLHSESKLRRFIAGTLPLDEIPRIVKRAAWNWKNHIFISDMMCPNMGLEFYDTTQTSWGTWYNSQCGVWYPGTNKGPDHKGRKGSLKNLISITPTKGIFVVFGCRGDPTEYARTMSAFRTHGIFGGRQTYRVPLTPTVQSVQLRDNEASRYLRMKRPRPTQTLLRKPNSPKAKRARITVNLPFLFNAGVFHPGVNTVTTRRPKSKTTKRRTPSTVMRS
jgi:hypothetical protein